ncbi:hypothetical protein ACJMK2_043153 [Sinanodonta woodiana]|uniref:Uncharacterized protein n=1 Tax=Sinanodonta woodiana TaxID=1069815 RepID=A0ABD3VW23_SINWO
MVIGEGKNISQELTLGLLTNKEKDEGANTKIYIYRELKKDDSMTSTLDTTVISNFKYNESMKSANKRRNQANVADDMLEVLGMINIHPYVQTIIHNKDQVPSIICYTPDQITDLQHFFIYGNKQPVGLDRTFILGNFYLTTLVYKNQRVVRNSTNEHPIFIGPVLLHKDASYRTYKSFLEHIATELDRDIKSVEVRVSEKNGIWK